MERGSNPLLESLKRMFEVNSRAVPEPKWRGVEKRWVISDKDETLL